MSQLAIELILAVLCFLLIWAILHYTAKTVTTPEHAIKWVINKTGLYELLKPEFRTRLEKCLIKRSILLTAIVIVVIVTGSFRAVRVPAEFLHNTFWPEAPSFLHIPQPRQNWLDFRARYLPLVGRDEELSALDDFLRNDSKFSWWRLSGKPGSGKSRIALEWLLSLPETSLFDGYHVGFFRNEVTKQYWRKWQPWRPTVMVIDDAAEYVDTVLDVLKTLGERADEVKYPVRVLLVGRSLPMSLKRLEEEEFYTDYRYKAEPLTVGPLEIKHLKVLAQELSSKRKKQLVLTPELEEKIMDISEGLPLLMTLALDSLLEYGVLRWSTYGELFLNQTQRIANKLHQDGLSQRCLPLLALSTFSGGIPWLAARNFCPDPACHDKGLMDKLFGEDTVKGIPPIKPDLLGEYFLLEQFGSFNEPQRIKFLETAWQSSPSGVFLTLFNLIQDFPEHPMVAELDTRPSDEKALVYWARVRVNLTDCAVSLSSEERELRWKEILKLAKVYPDNRAIRETLAFAACNMVYHFGKNKDWNKTQLAIDNLYYATKQFPYSIPIIRSVTVALANAISVFGENQMYGQAQTAFKTLQALAERLRDRTVQIAFVTGAANMMDCFGKLGLWTQMKETLTILDGLISRYPDHILVQRLISGALGNAINQFVRQEHFTELDATFEELRQIAIDFPEDTYIQLQYAIGLSNVIVSYEEQQCSAETQQMFQTLENIARRFPDDVKIQCQVARGAACGVNGCRNQSLDDMLSLFGVLRGVAERFPNTAEIQSHFALGASNAIPSLRVHKKFEDMVDMFETLVKIAKGFPDHIEIQCQLARAVANVVDDLGRGLSLCDAVNVFQIMQELFKEFPDSIRINSPLALASVRLIGFYSEKESIYDLQKVFSFLRELAEKHPASVELQNNLANGAYNAVKGYADSGHLNEMKDAFDFLRKLGEKHPKNEKIHLELALSAANAIGAYGVTGRLVDMQRTFDFLSRLANNYLNNEEIQLALAFGTANLISAYGEKGQLNDMQKALDFMGNLAEHHPKNVAIRLAFAASAYNAMKDYGESDDLDGMEKAFDVLRKVAKENSENVEIQLVLAMGAADAIKRYCERKCLDEMKNVFGVLIGVANSFPEHRGIHELVVHSQQILQNAKRPDENKELRQNKIR